MDNDVNALSLEDSEGSIDDQGSKSFNTEFGSLHLNSSLDSNRSGRSDKISRGKPTIVKSNSASQTYSKSKLTSPFVLQALSEYESIPSSCGYFSISPPPENEISNPNSVEISKILLNNMICNDNPKYSKTNSNTKKVLQKSLMRKMINKIRQHNVYQFIFDHGDTQLIKSCRCGQIQAVQESIKLLKDHQQMKLIDHQNTGNETALSIATNSMNEVLIQLLLMNGASPDIPLSMNNNVLHIAAAMTSDSERKTYSYLIKGIMRYGDIDKLLDTIRAKNIFDFDPIQILMLYRNANETDPSIYSCLQQLIDESIYIKGYYERSYRI